MGRILDSDLPREVAPHSRVSHTILSHLPLNLLINYLRVGTLTFSPMLGGLSGLEPRLREGEKVDTCYI